MKMWFLAMLTVTYSLEVVASNVRLNRCKVLFASTYNREWTFSPERTQALRELWSNTALSDVERHQGALKIIIEQQNENSGPVGRWLFRSTLASLDKNLKGMAEKGVDSFASITNRVSLSDPEIKTIEGLVAAVHEVAGHGFHKSQNPLLFWGDLPMKATENLFTGTRFSAKSWYLTEGHAIGAQWELLRFMPAEVRQSLIEKLKTARLRSFADKDPEFRRLLNQVTAYEKDPEGFRALYAAFKSEPPDMKSLLRYVQDVRKQTIDLYIETLEKAHLSKEQFIEALRPFHGYDYNTILAYHQNSLEIARPVRNVVRTGIATGVSLGLAQWLIHGRTQNKKEGAADLSEEEVLRVVDLATSQALGI